MTSREAEEVPMRKFPDSRGHPVSRRSALGLAGVAAAGLALSGCGDDPVPQPITAPPPDGVLGANFNGDPGRVTFAELENISATWLRGFFPMPQADRGAVPEHPVIRMLTTAAAKGYGTVLSLKFPYAGEPLPTPGSPAMTTALRRLDAVLPEVLGKVDILVIGNEPFIECRPQDRVQRLNVCYETLAQHVIAYRQRNCGADCTTQLYLGALNRLDRPDWRTPATERWLDFTRDTPALSGVDIHPHLQAPGDDRRFLDYVLPRLRTDQKFLATEFSLVLLWKQHLKDPVDPRFADRYRVSRSKKVWQVVRDAIESPFPQQKWDDFLALSPWFDNHREFLRDQVDRFRETSRLAVATYGVTQDTAMVTGFGPDSMPWLFNSVFCPFVVRAGQDGLPGRTTAWAGQFRQLQTR
ncbi:twin-arginine translocation signal domain-containing protein [Amycolatopsis jiangsuensis]|uniref:Uncharacterized protein n=1 Tax=Amycolatopsis jiangsuensis TaxID=1181879 RepID=A0A840IXJ5_9PSEU|nr:twin-arginine translocation signal domain-containing protein [Amycolatopsis jiangsuensis]MBB4687551.1 hypothetical protein [Amycolatopsis jiangsuensis]